MSKQITILELKNLISEVKEEISVFERPSAANSIKMFEIIANAILNNYQLDLFNPTPIGYAINSRHPNNDNLCCEIISAHINHEHMRSNILVVGCGNDIHKAFDKLDKLETLDSMILSDIKPELPLSESKIIYEMKHKSYFVPPPTRAERRKNKRSK